MPQPFVEMNSARRADVLAWAQGHDWGTTATWTDRGLRVTGFVTQAGFTLHERLTFSDFPTLRDWAGY